MKRSARSLAIVGLIGAGLVLAACGAARGAPTPAAPAVDQARATEIATNALEAYNAGDYAGWTRDWSQAMKAAIGERDFQGFRDQVMAARGRYVAIDGVQLISKQPGTYGYTFTVRFEKGAATVRFVFIGDGRLVEGVHYE